MRSCGVRVRLIPRIVAVAPLLTSSGIVVILVRGYRSVGAAALPSAAMQDELTRLVPYASLKDTPLREAVWFLQDAGFGLGAGNDIDFDEGALRAAGVSPDAPVTLEGRNIPLGLALLRVASSAGAACRADDDLVHISSVGEILPLNRFERPASADHPADARTLALLHQPDPSTTPSALRSARRPNRRGPVSLTRTTFGHALQKLGGASGLAFVVDGKALKSAGVDDDTPVSVTARSTTTANLLALVLRNASISQPLQFRAEDGVVRVSTRRQFDLEDRPRDVRRFCVAAGLVLLLLLPGVACRRRLRSAIGALRGFALPVVIGLCAVFFAAMVAFLPRPIQIDAFSRRLTIDSARGDLHVWVSPADPLSPYRRGDAPVRARSLAPFAPVPIATAKSFHGFSVEQRGWPYEVWLVRMRCWMAAAVTGAIPLTWFGWCGHARVRRWRRSKRGQCLACGYDLRESAGRCPECGAERPNAATLFSPA